MTDAETQKPGRLCVVATPRLEAIIADLMRIYGYPTKTAAVYAALIALRASAPNPTGSAAA